MLRNQSNKWLSIDKVYIEPRMASQRWETKWTKNKLTWKLGFQLMRNITYNWLSLDRTYDSVPTVRNKMNKEMIKVRT